METLPSPNIVRFGPFELNLRTGELRKRGIRLSLQQQPLEILRALLEAGGEIVSRQELSRRLWPNGTFVDFEHSLNAAVRRLRATLGDEAVIPRFIETVPRRGYRFLLNQPLARPAVAKSRGRLRLAVVPFEMFSVGLPADATFAEGFVDEIVTQLARTCPAHVGVIARTSVLSLGGHHKRAATVGHALDADYLVEGTIRCEGSRARITAQLIEVEQETHVWASSYDCVMSDTLTVQMEVAQAIATAVSLSLTVADSGSAVGF
jgi:TolB-like protein/DNA-binding winged helix-turn-helix (wHTH) protein